MTPEAPLFRGDRYNAVAGGLIEVRGALWKVHRVERVAGIDCVHCVGVSGICRGKQALFVSSLEPDLRVLDPASVDLVPDKSSGYEDSKLFLEAALRATPPVGTKPLVVGQAAIDDLPFQYTPVERILAQPRPRLMIADDVGLGKTLEAGLAAPELILRRRAARILVVTTRAMLAQFQKESWTRFSIPWPGSTVQRSGACGSGSQPTLARSRNQ